MKFAERLALIKAGYNRKEIEEMEQDVEVIPEEDKETEKTDPEPETGPEETEAEPDYKQLYEEAMTKIDTATKKIEELQKANTRRDNSTSTEKTDKDILRDIARSFM